MPSTPAAHDALADFATRHRKLFVLTGAGCSTDSGIPDYRDVDGEWKRPSPVTYQAFMGEESTRKRYWARSLIGWPTMAGARPGAAHRALARLGDAGRVGLLLTQNVDGLHEAAGSQGAIDLHGRIDTVRCMGCERRTPRAELQLELRRRNPRWAELEARAAPDGDADLEGRDFSNFFWACNSWACIRLSGASTGLGLGLSSSAPSTIASAARLSPGTTIHWVPLREASLSEL